MQYRTDHCTEKCKDNAHSATCRSRKRRDLDPIKYIWQNLKDRAKQRPKDFTITLPEFRAWCMKNDFQPGMGDSIDRIHNEAGYHIWNIQKMSLRDNIKKYHEIDKFKALQTEEQW
jgi:hypothetical protein